LKGGYHINYKPEYNFFYLFYKEPNRALSFITEFSDLFFITLAFDISFKANNYLFFLLSTFQTFPNPPFPSMLKKIKLFLDNARYIFIT